MAKMDIQIYEKLLMDSNPKPGYYVDGGRMRRLKDRDRFDGEDLEFDDDEAEFGIPVLSFTSGSYFQSFMHFRFGLFLISGFRACFIFLCGTLKSDTFNNQTDYSASMDGWDGWFENFDWQQYIKGQGFTDVS